MLTLGGSNCLYPKSFNISNQMGDLIDDYFQTHLSLTLDDARELHLRYYKDYGLAIEGLVRGWDWFEIWANVDFDVHRFAITK